MKLHLDWRAVYLKNLDEWDVDASELSGPPTNDGSCRFSVVEELDEKQAHLIAAAPNMLEILKGLRCGQTITDSQWHEIQEVIAKAEKKEVE